MGASESSPLEFIAAMNIVSKDETDVLNRVVDSIGGQGNACTTLSDANIQQHLGSLLSQHVISALIRAINACIPSLKVREGSVQRYALF